MNTVVRIAVLPVVAALSWLALLVLLASRSWIFLQTRGPWRRRTRYRFRQNGVFGYPLAPSTDQTVASTFRGRRF